jgi:AICARFT/IMPCHase bienzyme/MGS-like domain
MYALLSVSDKTGIIDFARGLIARGLTVASTGGTARVLTEAGISVVPVPDITGAPEMMDGRVKTLHPRIHGGILARRDHAGDREALSRFGITPIDVVAVNLYPFRQAAGNPATPVPELVEEIDIGGPSMIRAAAKNFPHVLVAVSPSDYPAILDALDQPGGPPLGFRLTLGQKAFMHTALYDAAIATELERVTLGPSGLQRQLGGTQPFGPHVAIGLRKLRDLRYGENPHQPAAWYAPDFGAEADLPSVLQGKELSFTNLLDLDAAARIVREFDEPASVVIKHTNPCGAATGSSLADAYVRARDADAISADRRGRGACDGVDLHRGRRRARHFRRGSGCAGHQEEFARGHRPVETDVRGIRVGRRRRADCPGRHPDPGARPRERSRGAVANWKCPGGSDEAAADLRPVVRAAVRVAHLRARQVECGDFHRRQSHAGDRRRPDEPRRLGEDLRAQGGRRAEGGGRRGTGRTRRTPPPTPRDRGRLAWP